MRVCAAVSPGNVAMMEIPVRSLKSDEILVRVCYAGICGTDVSIFTGESSFIRDGTISYPVRFGHEWSGVVHSVGTSVANFRPGDRVVGDNIITCGTCEFCLSERYQECTQIRCVGTIKCWDGCFADYIIMPERHLYHLNPSIPLDIAALMEPMSIALGAVDKYPITQASSVAVIGTGSIGIGAAVLAKHIGAGSVFLLGRNARKLDVAAQYEMDAVINSSHTDPIAAVMDMTGGRGVDFTIEASGAIQSVALAAELTRCKGTIALISFYEQLLQGYNIDRQVAKELSVVGVMGAYGNMARINAIMGCANLRLEHLITRRVPFARCPQAFEEMAQDESCIKTLIEMGEPRG